MPSSSQSPIWRLPRPSLVFWLVKTLIRIVIFLLASVALNIAQVLGLVFIFLCYLGGMNPSSWITFPLPFSLAFLRIGGLSPRVISGKQRIVGLSLLFIFIGSLVTLLPIGIIFILLDQWSISFRTPEIDFPSSGRWLGAGFGFCIDSFLYHLISLI